jgi:WhiB family redox-sensing transcriptional regulator
MTAPSAWRDRAACRDVVSADYDPFFADDNHEEQAALTICATCPVPDECLAFAVQTGQQWGVWGGKPQRTIRRLVVLDRQGRPQTGRVPAGHLNASKTHCKRGHPFDLANTYYAPSGERRCRACLRDAQPVRALRRLQEGGGSDAA